MNTLLKSQEFRRIRLELLPIIEKKACSMESREADETGENLLEYIGSRLCGCMDDKRSYRVMDYYRDSAGNYWYKNRVQLQSGEIVSMEQYLFGKEIKNKRKNIGKWQRRNRRQIRSGG